MEKINTNYFLEAEGLILGYHKAAPISQQPIYFKIPFQSVTALVGLNGSGKTTLIKSLIGESVLIDGSLKCFSHSIQSLSERDLSGLIAFVPQEPVYPSNLKVKHFLELAFLPQSHLFGKLPSIESTDCSILLNSLNLIHLLNKTLNAISSGERQRIFLAFAMLRKAPLIVLDEPTNHLDIQASRGFWKSLMHAKSTRPMEILISTHDLNFVEKECDWVLALKNGNLFFSGPKSVFFSEKWDEKMISTEG